MNTIEITDITIQNKIMDWYPKYFMTIPNNIDPTAAPIYAIKSIIPDTEAILLLSTNRKGNRVKKTALITDIAIAVNASNKVAHQIDIRQTPSGTNVLAHTPKAIVATSFSLSIIYSFALA